MKVKFELGLEGLRGVAALMVAYSHAVNTKGLLDTSYQPDGIFPYLQAGHGAVLVFFVLSGFVIGITTEPEFSWNAVHNYAVRRLTRIYPIYIFAIAITILVVHNSQDIALNHLAFLQPWASPVLDGNPILWTLSYEMLYYFLFILIWKFRVNLPLLIGVASIFSLIGWFLPDHSQAIFSFSAGWAFWLTGLWLAKPSQTGVETHNSGYISLFLLLLCMDHLTFGALVLHSIGLHNPNGGIINASDLTMLPVCTLLIAFLANRRIRYEKYWLLLAYSLPIVALIYFSFTQRLFENERWPITFLFYSLSILFISSQWNPFKKLAVIGSISYAVYVLHYPLAILVRNATNIEGTIESYLVNLIVWLSLVFLSSFLLEKRLQPFFKKVSFGLLMRKRAKSNLAAKKSF